ncbi:MAG: PhnD/SsuA/transferrin family substrate-binding protein [Deltaproteobacteria bacterium]|nr:PhnD/SsuA/transferrin family substrate-binding protein [Deltaproteobacteria bacterium]
MSSAFLVFSLLITGVSWGEDEGLVKIGVLAKRGDVHCLEKWSPTAEYLTAMIPWKKFAIVPLDHEQIYFFVKNRQVDFILSNPSFYVELEILYGANRIATLKNLVLGKAYTSYGGVIFCRADRDDIRHMKDLKNKTFMAVDETSLGGWRMAWREFKDHGVDPYGYFSNLRFDDTHDAVVYAVMDAKVDAGTVRTDTLERMHAEGKIDLSEFYVITDYNCGGTDFPFVYSTRMYPEWPFAKVKHTPDELAEAVAVALLAMPPDSAAARAAKCAGWTIPLNYQSVHECLRDLKVGPYKDLGKITLSDVIRNYWHWILLAGVLFLVMTTSTFVIFNLNRKNKASHVKLVAEVAERKAAEKKLIRAKEAAEAATKAKSEFLTNMSHEIRTPMNGVIGATDLALSEELPSKAKHYLQIIHASAYSLLGIINNILDFSKIEADELDLEMHPFKIDDVMDRVMETLINKAAEKRIEILVDIDPETPVSLIGDSLRLQQVLTNLTNNAVKFTEKSGVVIVGARVSEKSSDRVRLKFFVKDTGVGIAPEYVHKLFESFSQADTSITRKYEGIGLGLSICKELVERMEGKIWVESELGKGSTFTFTARFGLQTGVREQQFLFPCDIQYSNVLVVDDCADSRLIMQNILESYGFKVKSVSSGKEALSILEKNSEGKEPFDIIMMDWVMPGLNGINTSRKIREDLKLTVPIIMMTAFGKKPEKLEAKRAGVNGFLTKPINRDTLFNTLCELIKTKETPIQPPETIREDRPLNFSALLKQLADSLEIADPEEIKKQMEVVRKHLDPSIFQELENHVNTYDYDEALETLKKFAESISIPRPQ